MQSSQQSPTTTVDEEYDMHVPFQQPKIHIASDQLNSHAIFRKIAKLPSQTAQARLIFTYPLWQIDKHLQTYTAESEYNMKRVEEMLKDSSLYKQLMEVHDDVRESTNELKLRWYSYRQAFFRTSNVGDIMLDTNGYITIDHNSTSTRRKRFAFLPLLAIAVVTGISTWAAARASNLANDGPSKQGVKFLVKQVHDLQISHEAIKRAFHELHDKYGNKIDELTDKMQLEDYRSQYFIPLLKLEAKMSKVMHGLDMCNMNALSPDLVSAKNVEDAMIRLEAKGKKDSFFLPHESVGYVYQQRIEYFTEWHGMLHIVVKLFMVERSSVLDLYEYINLPLLIKGLKFGIEPRTEHTLMAISASRDRVMLMDKDQLQDCKEVSGLTLCPNLDFYYKKPKDYCLSSLFLADYEAAKRTCNFQLVPQIDKLVQTSPTTFILFNSVPKTLTINCPNRDKPFMEHYVGSMKWRVQTLCVAFTDTVHFKAAPRLDISLEIAEAANAFQMQDVLGNLTVSQIKTVLPEELTRELPLVDIIKQYNEIEELHAASSFSPKGFSVSIVTTVVLFIILFTMIFCARHKIKACFMRASDKAHARRLNEHGFEQSKTKKSKKRSRVIWKKANTNNPVEIEMTDAKDFSSSPNRPVLNRNVPLNAFSPSNMPQAYAQQEPLAVYEEYQPNVRSPMLPHRPPILPAHHVQEFLDRESRNRPTNVYPI